MVSQTLLRTLLLLVVVLLCGLGMVMVGSTTTLRGAKGGLNFHALGIQGVALVIGGLAALTISLLGLNIFRQKWVNILGALLVVGLLLVVPFVAEPINGAYRWIRLGPINLQPAELAKVAMVLVAAWYLVGQQERVRVHWYGVLLPLMGFAVLALLVYRTRDLGSVVVLGLVLWSMLFFAGARWLYFTLLGIASLPLVTYITIFSEGYRRDRMLAFRDPWAAEGPAGYHLQQSEMAIASGGMHGMGLGQGTSKHGFLPEFHTDFIYAIICEELGMIGGIMVAFGFLLLVMIGLTIAHRAGDRYGRLVAIGATMLLGFQAFWNMLVVTGAVPTKGLTLPFISYGGTSLVVSLVLVGLLDAVARTIPREPPERAYSTTRLGAVMIPAQRPARRWWGWWRSNR